ncbi:MAG TPA: hypothetical protein PLD25_08995 [Chloroflexota bacterium]|nr:hypothetical protein [Chloroflexota bacterium]HUM68244.1 hypothetical protein [Chloroflexota bacterium]
MEDQNRVPDLKEFLLAPADVVAQMTPKSVIFASGGTRRAAALAGIEFGDEFARWNLQQMMSACELFFRQGVEHLIMPMGSPKMFAEGGLYGQRLVQWLTWGLAGKESLAHYQQVNWQVRIVTAGATMPELLDAAQVVMEKTKEASGPYVWFVITPDFDQMWRWVGQAFVQGARNRLEAVRALYGYAIPPASLMVSFGKPLISQDVLPPLLYEEIQCYWTQQPGYSLDEDALRRILYDYAFLRATWRSDKTGRAEEAIHYREAWEKGPIVGLGQHLGPFWYPLMETRPLAEKSTED